MVCVIATTTSSASAVSHLDGLVLVAPLVLGVEGEELEDEEVEDAGDEGEAEHDEDEDEGDVLGRLLQRVVLLQRHVVPEPDRRQRREPVVDGVQVAPLCKQTNNAAIWSQLRDRLRDRAVESVGAGYYLWAAFFSIVSSSESSSSNML